MDRQVITDYLPTADGCSHSEERLPCRATEFDHLTGKHRVPHAVCPTCGGCFDCTDEVSKRLQLSDDDV